MTVKAKDAEPALALNEPPVSKGQMAVMPPASESAQIMDIIRQASANPEMDVDKLERLLALQERAQARDAERAFSVAMMEAQEEVRPIAADAANKQTQSKYASYLALDKALRPIYTKHGFALSFDTGDATAPDMIRVLCYVSHKAGHTRTYKIDMPADGKGAKGGDVMTKTHATGSAATYGQRYLLKLIFNIAVGDDDDGNGAGGNSGLISEDQAQTIRDMLDRENMDIEKFCAFMKVDAIAHIRAPEYRKAVTAINEASLARAAKAKK